MTQWIAKGTGASEFYTLVPENPRGGPFDFLGGGGWGWKNWFAQEFFSLTGQWFSFTVRALREFFSQIFHPPLLPSKVKWSIPYIKFSVVSSYSRKCISKLGRQSCVVVMYFTG